MGKSFICFATGVLLESTVSAFLPCTGPQLGITRQATSCTNFAALKFAAARQTTICSLAPSQQEKAPFNAQGVAALQGNVCLPRQVPVSASKVIKAWVLSLVFALSSIFWMPNSANAVGSTSSSMYAGLAVKSHHHRNDAGHKRMVLIGTGIPETLQKVFVMLDTHNTGSISKQTLKSALLELKRRGYMSVSLSDDQLDSFLDKLVEKNKMELNAAAAAGDPTAAEAARLLAQKGPQIRFDTFVKAVDFAEKKDKKKWPKKTRRDFQNFESKRYGHGWKPEVQQNTLQQLGLHVAQFGLVTFLTFWLPFIYIWPWEIFRFGGGMYKDQRAKKALLKRTYKGAFQSEGLGRFRSS